MRLQDDEKAHEADHQEAGQQTVPEAVKPILLLDGDCRRPQHDRDLGQLGWLDGDTDRVAGGGSLSCAAGPGGGGCFGFAWWQNDADYNAQVWDLKGLEAAGSVTADVSGTSFLPALVVPIPLIARARAAACKGLAEQLRTFIVDEPAI